MRDIKVYGCEHIDGMSVKDKIMNYSNMLRLSSNQKYGVPLPFFQYKDNKNKYLLNTKQMEHIRDLFMKEGTKIWYDWSVSQLLHEDYVHLHDQLDKIDACIDNNIINGLYFYSLDSQNNNNMIIESVDRSDGWLLHQSLLQAAMRMRPTYNELKMNPLLIDRDGSIISNTDSYASSSRSIVDGSVKLNDQSQYGMGAEVVRLWIASIDIYIPKSNSIVLDEHMISSTYITHRYEERRVEYDKEDTMDDSEGTEQRKGYEHRYVNLQISIYPHSISTTVQYIYEYVQ